MYMQLDLPGFGQQREVDVLPGAGAKVSPVAEAVSEALKGLPVVHPVVWARSRLDLQKSGITPLERAAANVAALKVAANLTEGSFPSAADRDTLGRFCGWGRLSEMFKPNPSANWQGMYADVASVVGDDHMDAVRAGTTTSFFTPPAIARAVWNGLVQMGFTGGRVLDPAAGHGAFLAQMPEDVAKRSHITAIEPEPASARVLKALYSPYGANVMETTFEEAALPQAGFDLVITNVPFGDFATKENRHVPFQSFLIHDYFLARAMEVVRPGGLVAVLTSTGTMEKSDHRVRSYLASKARLVTAVRLPTDAFADFAGTQTSVDVLIFQRLDGRKIARNGDDWIAAVRPLPLQSPRMDPKAAQDWDVVRNGGLRINDWFASHESSLLGYWTQGRDAYGHQGHRSLISDGQGWQPRLDALMASLPGSVYTAAQVRPQPRTMQIDVSIQPGSFLVGIGGELCVADEVGVGSAVAGKSKALVERIVAMVALRDQTTALLAAQATSTDELGLLRDRNALNIAYDAFVAKFGALTSSANTRAFAGDPAAYLLQALEVATSDGSVEKSALLTKRTVSAPKELLHCDSAEDALKASLARYGVVNADWMAKLVGKSTATVMEGLASDGLVFRDHATLGWETASAYLSGDVRTKLREVEAMGRGWEANAAALREVVPSDLMPSEIRVALGSTWVPADVYEAFASEVFNAASASIAYDALTGSWSLGNCYCTSVAARNAYGVAGRLDPPELMEKAMNQQDPTVTDPDPSDSKKRVVNQVLTIEAREKQEALKKKFVEWAWQDAARAQRLADLYNAAFRSLVPRAYDGSHIDLPGYSHYLTLQPHQKNGVWRVVTSPGNTLLAHKVGYGKTLQMVCGGMELRRLGIASKIAYVVPGATLGDFVIEFVRAYPRAKLLVATEKDFDGANRRRFLARAATGDWDGVVLSHSSFERIRVSDDAVKAFIQGEIAGLKASSSYDGTVKQKERMVRKWESKLARIVNGKGDTECLSFDQIGFDWLMVDEAHYFKNLFRFSKMGRLAGLPSSDSERAFDMFLKCRLVTQAHGGKRGIVFATGTPVANSMAELHVMQRFLQASTLQRASVEAFDSWAANFGEAVTALEVAPDGSGYRMNRRFARFVNIPELMAMFREVADIQVDPLPYLKVPAFARDTVVSKGSAVLHKYVEQLVERSEKVHAHAVSPKKDNMLAITNDGRMAALDMRLVDPTVASDPDGKIALCAQNVLRIWHETEAEKLTQAVFSDVGVSDKGGRFSVYDELRYMLVAGGVPESQIAFAQDAETHAARSKLAAAVRDGRVRIVMGSTQKLGVGVNIQTRLVALHHLDAPWRPADIEQREGRIIRQRNRNERVWIYRYVTEGSFDAYMWQTLETKARFIAQVMSGDTAIRTAEDLELAALSYAEVKALASGNPLIVEKAGVDAEVARLAILKSAHAAATARAKRELAKAPEFLAAATRRKDALEADIATRKALPNPVFEVRGRHVPISLAGKVIHAVAIANVYAGSKPARVGTFGPFEVTVSKRSVGGYDIAVTGEAMIADEYQGGAISAQHSFERLVGPSFIQESATTVAERIATIRRRNEENRFEAVRPFEKEARYQELLARQAELQDALGLSDQVDAVLESVA